MNIVFFSSDNFAASSLKALLTTEHKICSVVTQPDKAKGRGLAITATPVKRVAGEVNLGVYQSKDINTLEAIKFLKGLNPDLFVVIAYGQILSPEILEIPKHFCINVHASLLPKYRGAAPINWAIINAENETGITIIKMTPKMDAGPIIIQRKIDISDTDTAITLEDKLSQMAAQLLLDSLNLIENNNYNLTPQDEAQVSFAPKLQKQDGLIDWSKSAEDIYNLIRGCLPWPGAFTYYNGKLLKIFNARVSLSTPASPADRQQTGSSSSAPASPLDRPQSVSACGQVIEVSKKGISVAAGKGILIIEELQIEGKRRMRVEEFILGHKITAGEILGKK